MFEDSNKLQRHNVQGDIQDDMITNLPDCILHYILSLLPTKDAIRTSVLAKKWKYLWTDLSVFDFQNYCSPATRTTPDQRQKSAKCLLDQVERVLYHSNCVKRLSVMIYQGLVDAGGVNSLISAASKHKIEELKLSVTSKPPYVLPNCFSAFESLNSLDLELVCVLDVASDIHFPSLKKLKLSYVTFANGKSVQQLFSGCPVLQELNLYNSDWRNIKKITITFPTLKILSISCNYRHDSINSIKIDAVNLSNFTCKGYLPTTGFFLVKASTVDAHIDVWCYNPFIVTNKIGPRTIEILSGLGSIKSLRLSTDTLECLSYTESSLHLLPMFNNLTHLRVDSRHFKFTNKTLMDFLQKTPNLEVLDIPRGFDPQICLNGENWTLNSVPFCFKYSLKLFSILEFDGSEAEIKLLKFMLENATVLGEIRIFWSKTLVDLKKQVEISNQLQPLVLENCVIKFQ